MIEWNFVLYKKFFFIINLIFCIFLLLLDNARKKNIIKRYFYFLKRWVITYTVKNTYGQRPTIEIPFIPRKKKIIIIRAHHFVSTCTYWRSKMYGGRNVFDGF